MKCISISSTNRAFGLVFYYNSITIAKDNGRNRFVIHMFHSVCVFFILSSFHLSYNSNQILSWQTWNMIYRWENMCLSDTEERKKNQQFNVNGMNVNDSICTYSRKHFPFVTPLTFLRNDFVCVFRFSLVFFSRCVLFLHLCCQPRIRRCHENEPTNKCVCVYFVCTGNIVMTLFEVIVDICRIRIT